MSAVACWQDAPLRGRLLVEASAGTGKTWTMAALYLRLLLERPDGAAALTPERIVVATYTDAAAQELGERLRARVSQALQAAQPGAAALDATDPVQAWLATRWQDPRPATPTVCSCAARSRRSTARPSAPCTGSAIAW